MRNFIKIMAIWLMGVSAFAQDITFYKGQSVTFTIVFNNEYSPTRLTDINVSLNNKSLGKKSTGQIATTANPRAFRLALSSTATSILQYDYNLQLSIIDSALGVRYFAPLKVKVLTSNGIVGSNTNLSSDFQINVTVNNNVTTISPTTLSIYQGYSAYQVAVNNGFVGTEAAWLATFTVPKDTAVLARDQALAYRNSAAASASTATTQATNASNSAAAAAASASTIQQTQTIGNTVTSTSSTSNSALCYIDFSKFTQVGKLTSTRVNAVTTGNIILVHFNKTATNTWTEKSEIYYKCNFRAKYN